MQGFLKVETAIVLCRDLGQILIFALSGSNLLIIFLNARAIIIGEELLDDETASQLCEPTLCCLCMWRNCRIDRFTCQWTNNTIQMMKRNPKDFILIAHGEIINEAVLIPSRGCRSDIQIFTDIQSRLPIDDFNCEKIGGALRKVWRTARQLSFRLSIRSDANTEWAVRAQIKDQKRRERHKFFVWNVNFTSPRELSSNAVIGSLAPLISPKRFYYLFMSSLAERERESDSILTSITLDATDCEEKHWDREMF